MTVTVVKRMKPLVYARWCDVSKETVYNWINTGRLPEGATAVKTATNRYIIHVDESKHPEVPLLTDK